MAQEMVVFLSALRVTRVQEYAFAFLMHNHFLERFPRFINKKTGIKSFNVMREGRGNKYLIIIFSECFL